MKKINKLKDLISQNQPAYYISTSDFSYNNGKRLSKTWADFIRLDTEHSSFDLDGINKFMKGLIDGGPTKSGHLTPTVLAELPFNGESLENVKANSWQIKQLLAKGIHGLILCHTTSHLAVKEFVENCRYPLNKIGVSRKLNIGKRGHGGQKMASKIWGISERDYLYKADVWPLNPNGEIILGLKFETNKGVNNSFKSCSIPGICFAELGLGDIYLNNYIPSSPLKLPIPKKINILRNKVWKNAKKNKLKFLGHATENNILEQIDKGISMIRVYDKKIASKGKLHSKRKKPW